jgi:hypothetical protein
MPQLVPMYVTAIHLALQLADYRMTLAVADYVN